MSSTPWDGEKIAELVSRLTLEQKVAQLGGFSVTDLLVRTETAARLDPTRLPELRPHGVGHLSMVWFLGEDIDRLTASLEEVQAAVRDLTPFGIGALVHIEAVNGFLHASGDQFPTAWAQAATWDPDLVERMAAVSAAHMSRSGMHLAFSPVMDIARDPRWGRVHETYGEDPELAARFSVAFVRGLQGRDGEHGVLATGKHFLGYGSSEGGLNQAATQLGRRVLVDEYAEPFRRAITEADLRVVMNSYNEIDGVPVAANHWALTELLRDELGFEGLAVSDYDAVALLKRFFHTATTEGQAAAQALTAGLDVELPGDVHYRHLADEVAAGRVDERVVDTAVARVLAVKARLGLVPDLGTRPRRLAAPDPVEATEVRQAMAHRSLVLLENDGVLPLPSAGKRIVVVGPAAHELRVHFGAYTSVSNAEVPLGMRAVMSGQVAGVDPATFVFTDLFQVRMPGMDPVFEDIAHQMHPDAPTVLEALRAVDPSIAHAPLGRFEVDPDAPLVAAEVEAAVADADVVIAVVGERTGWVGNNTAGEGQSTANPVLPGDQEELLALLAATDKPLVTVVVSGRPLVLTEAAVASNAVLLAPLLGEEGGNAVAAALFGATNPSGRLPSTFPRHVGQIPLYHGHHYGSGYEHPTGTRHGYGDLLDGSPLYPFGHGLSYTSFDVAFSGPDVVELADGHIRARLTATNTGDVDGETVVQLYARDEAASIVRPVRQLLAFARIALAAGESAEITLDAPVERLFYTMLDGRRGVESGEVTVMAALSSADVRDQTTIMINGTAE
ncbi:glycoside hydrolase family 3 N-terminal domain-containing protein [Lentzea sp. NPDC051208]|uniref:glycoside hydrolase family 3 N-terminal domain-containing protein n=1 Tax=Lentzea sp. NPDC051208 TaxID=3154642 RepID=UPI00341A10D5